MGNKSQDTSSGGYLGRVQIMDAPSRTYDDVAVPEWGGKVRVQSLTAEERDEWEISITNDDIPREKRLANLRARLVVRTVVDGDGALLFNVEDAKPLGQKSAAVVERVFMTAAKLSGITAQDVEALASNSSAGPSGDSSTD